MNAKLTKISSISPSRLTKRWTIIDGKPVKESGGNMSEGFYTVEQVGSLQDFANLIDSLESNQALCYGIPEKPAGRMMSKMAYKKAGCPNDACTRSKADMQYDSGPGVFFIDYDPPEGTKSLNHTQIWDSICVACPSLKDVGYVTIPSSSSFIKNNDTGEQITSLSGQRIYFFVKSAVEIRRAGDDFIKRLWLAGFGHGEVSKSGAKLKRTLVDGSVWQPNKLDFAAGAECVEPLFQDRGMPVVVPGRYANLSSDIPELTSEELKRHDEIVSDEMEAIEPQAKAIREAYYLERGKIEAGPTATPEHIEKCVATVRRACEGGTIGGDLTIITVQDGKEVPIKVLELLMDKEKWHGVDCLDPIEPEYRGRMVVGKVYLLNGSPRLYTFAHGGRTYKLVKSPEMIEVSQGRIIDVFNQTMEVMRKCNDVFEFGNNLVKVDETGFTELNDHSLVWWMGEHCQYYRRKPTKNGSNAFVDELCDPSLPVAKMISSIGRQRRIPELRRIVNAPVLKPDGLFIDKPTFDKESGLLLSFDEDDVVPIKEAPSIQDAIKAYDSIMNPFKLFPFVGVEDATVMLTAVLSAVMRPVLNTCPGFGFDAPIQGSGKTLLAKCLHAIATGRRADVVPHVGGKEDEEIRKRVMALLISGAECVVWDNIMGIFNSPSLAGLLTSENYTDRILGGSKNATVPNMALWLFTGNNLQLAGDMPRRVFRCRIDPAMSDPYAREFDFDPESYCIEKRFGIIASAMTIIKAWMFAGRPHSQGRTASFEDWDDLVRQPISWLSSFIPDKICDPMEVMKSGQSVDPEQSEWGVFLDALYAKYGSDRFTVRDLIGIVENVKSSRSGSSFSSTVYEADETIYDCITDTMGSRDINGRRLGRFFLNRMDRICAGKRITRAGENRNGAEWVVHLTENQTRSQTHTEKADIGDSNVPF
jgi:hypothetical protein